MFTSPTESPRGPGDAPRSNAVHWRRYRRLMAWMLLFSLTMVGLALWWMHREGVVLHLHFMIAMGLGITLSLMLGAGLMGLVFVSSRTGIDDEVEHHGRAAPKD